VIKRFDDVDLDIAGDSPEQLRALVQSESARWSKLARSRNIKAE
jgi:hypothetical protein